MKGEGKMSYKVPNTSTGNSSKGSHHIMEYKHKWILQSGIKSENTIKHESEEFIIDNAHELV